MYAGFIPRIVGVVPMRFVFWGVQDSMNSYLKHYRLNRINKSLLIGITAASFQTIIDNPIDMNSN